MQGPKTGREMRNGMKGSLLRADAFRPWPIPTERLSAASNTSVSGCKPWTAYKQCDSRWGSYVLLGSAVRLLARSSRPELIHSKPLASQGQNWPEQHHHLRRGLRHELGRHDCDDQGRQSQPWSVSCCLECSLSTRPHFANLAQTPLFIRTGELNKWLDSHGGYESGDELYVCKADAGRTFSFSFRPSMV